MGSVLPNVPFTLSPSADNSICLHQTPDFKGVFEKRDRYGIGTGDLFKALINEMAQNLFIIIQAATDGHLGYNRSTNTATVAPFDLTTNNANWKVWNSNTSHFGVRIGPPAYRDEDQKCLTVGGDTVTPDGTPANVATIETCVYPPGKIETPQDFIPKPFKDSATSSGSLTDTASVLSTSGLDSILASATSIGSLAVSTSGGFSNSSGFSDSSTSDGFSDRSTSDGFSVSSTSAFNFATSLSSSTMTSVSSLPSITTGM